MLPLMVAAAVALSFRVVPLACTPNGLVISGGGVLRMAPQATCAAVVPGRAIAVTLDDDNRVTPQAPDPGSHPAKELPKAAYAFAPASSADDDGSDVTISIVVTIPPATPAGSDIYLSTERSGFNPSEVRMDQLDARRYRLQLRIHDGGRIAFRVTRGSFATIERDARGRLPPPHLATGHAGATIPITVEAWSDDT